jgi:hypothetical protein
MVVVTNAAQLNFETGPVSYTATVTASDNHVPPLTSTTSVQVNHASYIPLT